jgi:hypothetical protein
VGKPKRRRPLGRLRHRWEDVGMDVNTGNTDFFCLTRNTSPVSVTARTIFLGFSIDKC